jgi:hypothetical protein
MIELEQYQLDAINLLSTGSILCGGVGSGKSRTALGYFVLKESKGQLVINGEGMYRERQIQKDLYIITTALKRDSWDWEYESMPFEIPLYTKDRIDKHKSVMRVDSWNNIAKYEDVRNAFFIFDEQRLVGAGAWVKSFLKIAKNNNWILLSATPGDTWSDYIPVFIANKFVKNRTEFMREYVVFARYTNFPKIERYLHERRLNVFRDKILVNMYNTKHTIRHVKTEHVSCDMIAYKKLMENRWNPYTNKPVENITELCNTARRIINEDKSRIKFLKKIYYTKQRVIVFYNFDYELEILRAFAKDHNIPYSEWNGHNHEPIPDTETWIYLVQYIAGAEGWNCIITDTTLFYSLNYSYKIMEQASGRIDRMNTPYTDLFYYQLITKNTIDDKIAEAVDNKKTFTERGFVTELTRSQKKHAL